MPRGKVALVTSLGPGNKVADMYIYRYMPKGIFAGSGGQAQKAKYTGNWMKMNFPFMNINRFEFF